MAALGNPCKIKISRGHPGFRVDPKSLRTILDMKMKFILKAKENFGKKQENAIFQ